MSAPFMPLAFMNEPSVTNHAPHKKNCKNIMIDRGRPKTILWLHAGDSVQEVR